MGIIIHHDKVDAHVVIVGPPLGVLGPFCELQVPFYRDTHAHIKGVSKMYVFEQDKNTKSPRVVFY